MAFNITGGVSVTVSVPRRPPLDPVSASFSQLSKNLGKLTWTHNRRLSRPHNSFRIETKPSSGDDTAWVNFASVEGTSADSNVADLYTYSIEVANLNSVNENQDFRVWAAVAVLGSPGGDTSENPSPTATFELSDLEAPTVVTLSGTGLPLDQCLLEWTHVPNFRCISYFTLECQEQPSFSDLDDNGWLEIGTVAATSPVGTDAVAYSFIRNGYAIEDGNIWYRVRAVTTDGTLSDNSPVPTDPQFTPRAPNAITKFAFVRTGVDSGEFSWAYDDVIPIRSFILEAQEVGTVGFSAVSTIDANTPTQERDYDDGLGGTITCDIRTFTSLGYSAEANSIQYRMRTVGLNGVPSDTPTNPITVAPIAPPAPSVFTGVVNLGQGTLTSITLAWTPPAPTFTNITQIILEFRPLIDDAEPWRQVGVFSPDEDGAEVVPPSQGLIEYRLRSVGENTLLSPVADSPSAQFVVTAGTATDDAIYNGDAAFIAQRHFSVDRDDRCMFIENIRGETVTLVSGGTYVAPTRTGTGSVADPFVYTAGSITGAVDESLIIDWTLNIDGGLVDRQRHFFLNTDIFTRRTAGDDLNATRSVGGDPSTTWGVDRGTVFIQVSTDPGDTGPLFKSGTTDFFYADHTGDATNTRTHDDRIGGTSVPMYADRRQIHLNMRRTFTFRTSGLVRLRITFNADQTGYPIVPVYHGDLDTNDFRQDDSVDKVCFEAWASSLDESRSVTLTAASGVFVPEDITFMNEYEEPPMITGTPDGPCITWVSAKDETTATINASALTTAPADGDTCTVDLTIRGY